MKKPLINRVRIYFNYGGIGFLVMLMLLNALDGILTLLLPVTFNLILWRALSVKEAKRQSMLIGMLSGCLTTGIFWIQYNYYRYNLDWGCLKMVSENQANVSYVTNLILFSIVMWEIGIRITYSSRTKITI